MNYADWLKTVPVEIREDPLWNQEAHRLALFAADLAWHDTTKTLLEFVPIPEPELTEYGTRNTENGMRNSEYNRCR